MQDARAGADRAAPIGTVVLQVQATLTVVVLPEVQPGTTHLIGAGAGRGGGRRGGRGRGPGPPPGPPPPAGRGPMW